MSALVSKYDPQRTLRFAIFGMAMGPVIGESGVKAEVVSWLGSWVNWEETL